MSNTHLLKKADEYIELALRREHEKRYDLAREYYLLASKMLFESAKYASDKIKVIRIRNAERLMDKAKLLSNDASKEGEGIVKITPIAEKPKVRFDSIAGLDGIKDKIKELIIYPYLYPDKARKWKVKSSAGVLLYGPPGNGKTLLAKAIANEIDAKFYYIKASDIMSKWVGESEQRIAQLFNEARKERSIIFIDEVDALLPKRISINPVMQRIVPQFLAEIDGLDSNDNILLIAATNLPWDLDPAVLRSGRFDFKFYIPLPDHDARKQIFMLNLDDLPRSDLDYDLFASKTQGYSGADIRLVCDEAKRFMLKEEIDGNDAILSNEVIIKAINLIKPSINKGMLDRYEQFNKLYSYTL